MKIKYEDIKPSMKKEKPQAKTSAKPAAADQQSEDFFTAFLAKKKKAQTKKLEEIATLKTSGATLNKEQQDKIGREGEFKRQCEYYDEIRNLYFEAMSKQENDQSTWLTPDAKLRGILSLHLSHDKLPTSDEKSAQLDTYYSQIFESHKIEEAFSSAKKFLENKELNEYLSKCLGNLKQEKEKKPEAHKEAQHSKNAHEQAKPHLEKEHAKPHKEPTKKEQTHEQPKQDKPQTVSGKFLQDDEDEDHDKHHKTAPAQSKPQHTEAQPKNPAIMLLPEGDEKEEEEWVTSDQQPKRHFSGRRRGPRGQGHYQGEGNRGRRFPRRGDNGGEGGQFKKQDQQDHDEDEEHQGGEQPERRGRYRGSWRGRGDRGRRPNPEGEQDDSGDKKDVQYVQKA